jgi:hypothetical protein
MFRYRVFRLATIFVVLTVFLLFAIRVSAGSHDLSDAHINLCGSGKIIKGEIASPDFDGKMYFRTYDYSRGQETINSAGCGREYLIQDDPKSPYYELKLTYLIDGYKKQVFPTLYVEQPDGMLKIFEPSSVLNKESRSAETQSEATSAPIGSCKPGEWRIRYQSTLSLCGYNNPDVFFSYDRPDMVWSSGGSCSPTGTQYFTNGYRGNRCADYPACLGTISGVTLTYYPPALSSFSQTSSSSEGVITESPADSTGEKLAPGTCNGQWQWRARRAYRAGNTCRADLAFTAWANSAKKAFESGLLCSSEGCSVTIPQAGSPAVDLGSSIAPGSLQTRCLPENRRKWGCQDVRCNVYPNPKDPGECPARVIGNTPFIHPTSKAACDAAKLDANSKVPRGCVKRHCNCATKCTQG